MAYVDTHVPMPNAASALFYSQLITWFQNEDQERYADMFDPFVVTGFLHAVPSPGSLTTDPFSGEAYGSEGGYILQESTTVTYSDGDGTYWVIATEDWEENHAGWTTVIGTHIRWQKTASQPPLPPRSVWLMQVTVAGGAITAVGDLRNLTPIDDIVEALLIDLLTNDPDVLAALEAIIENLILTDPDIAAFITGLINTILAGINFVDGANVGTGTGEVFRNSTGSLPEVLNFKTLKEGSNITITNNANDVTIAATNTDTTYTGANVGAGSAAIFKQIASNQFQFRTVSGTGGVSVSQNGDVVEVDGSGISGSGTGYAAEGTTAHTPDVTNFGATQTYTVRTINSTVVTGSPVLLMAMFEYRPLATATDPDKLRIKAGSTVLYEADIEQQDVDFLWPVSITAVDITPTANQTYTLEIAIAGGHNANYHNSSLICFQYKP